MVKNNHKKGISLLIAVLISSVSLLFSYSVSNLALKEVLLSQAGRDSQVAFYASNSGVECGLYWDLKNHDLGGGPSFPTDGSVGIANIDCVDDSVSVTNTENDPGDFFEWQTDDFLIDGDNDGPCFKLTITKTWLPADGYYETVIESRGNNICDPNNARRLERALKVIY